MSNCLAEKPNIVLTYRYIYIYKYSIFAVSYLVNTS